MTQVAAFTSANLGSLASDPIATLRNVQRKLPKSVASRISQFIASENPDATTRAIVAAYLSDYPDTARELLNDKQALNRVESTIAGSLALEHPGMTSKDRARQAYNFGDLDVAAASSSTSLATLAESHRRLLTEEISIPSIPARPDESTDALKVLYFLNSSLPTTTAGYTLRTQQLLAAAQAEPDILVEPVTRLGYPFSIGVLPLRDVTSWEGISYQRLTSPIIPSLPLDFAVREAQQLAELAVRRGIDLIHTTTDYQRAVPAQAAARALGIPWVYEMRGERENSWVASFPVEHQERVENSAKYRLIREKETRLAQQAGAVIVLSEVQKQRLCERGIPAEKIFVAPNGVSAATLNGPLSQAEARTQLGLDQNSYLVGTVSSIVDYEGLDTLVRAVAACRDRIPQIKLVIVGDGTYRNELLRLVDELALDDIAITPGKVSPNQAALWTAALDVFCVPRRDTTVTRTVTPLKSIAALAGGIPTLVSDIPALHEIIPAHLAGELSLRAEDTQAWAEAIVHFSQVERRDEIAEDLREFAATRTWEAAWQNVRAAYAYAREY